MAKKQAATAEPKTVGMAECRRIAELANIPLTHTGQRRHVVGSSIVKYSNWRPDLNWGDAMTAAVACGLEMVIVADGPAGVCLQILEGAT